MTVLIVLLWTLGGIPRPSRGGTGEHTGGDDGVRVLVHRRPEAVMVLEAAPDHSAALPPRSPYAVPVAMASRDAAPRELVQRTAPIADIERWASPRGPPSTG